MMDDTGARAQESLRRPPALVELSQMNSILEGVIMPNGVIWKDSEQNTSGQTLVNISLFDGYPDIYNVRLSTDKYNRGNGEEWSPEPGDLVIVGFLGGSWAKPVVLRHLHLPQMPADPSDIQSDSSKVGAGERRYHKRCNQTDEVIDKSGNRITTVAVDETLTIKNNRTTDITNDESLTVHGQRTTIIEDNETVTVNAGDITITATAGKCTVTIKGKTAWRSDGGIELDGKGGGTMGGVLQQKHLCQFHGNPFETRGAANTHFSSTVTASKE